MIESDWKKFCERVRDKQTIAQDEVVIKEAIEALHPGATYTMTNIDLIELYLEIVENMIQLQF